MDTLQNQVSDLRAFLEPTRPAVGSATPEIGYSLGGQGPPGVGPPLLRQSQSQNSAHSAPFNGDNSAPQTPANANSKRRLDDADLNGDPDADSTSKQPRTKRNRYISIACNECKRRKIKCNGQAPCQRCGHLNLQCLYAPNCCPNNFRDSDEFKDVTEQVSRLQAQVDSLAKNLDSLRQEGFRLAPIHHDRALPPPIATVTPPPSLPSLPKSLSSFSAFRVPPSFSGPTSIAYTVDVAKNTLHNMGYTEAGDAAEDVVQPERTDNASPRLGQAPTTSPLNPLWELGRDEMIRLCRIHEEEVGVMYPVISIDSVIDHAINLTSWMDTVKRNGLVPPNGPDYNPADSKTLMLTIVLCCALVVEEHGHSAKATRLYGSIEAIVNQQLMSEPALVTRLPFLALCAGYRYLSSDEILAWRMMGHVARLCLELGLHRREGLEKIRDPQDRRNALHTFWSAYVLDRRWSFSTGLPFVLHDDKIDPKLPLPEHYPFMVAMISYSKLGAKIWKLVDYFEPTLIRELKKRDIEELDSEILEWYKSVPQEIQTGPTDVEWIPAVSATPTNEERLQVWTRLRLNQVRIWLYTPVLWSAISINENISLAEKAVDLAKETIRSLAFLNNTTNLYRRIQVFYHQFLTSSIAVLFLASTHAPIPFSAICRDEFFMALELVKDMSARSWVSQRLWRTVRSLKAYAPRLGLEHNAGEPMLSPYMKSAHPHESVSSGSWSISDSQSPRADLAASRAGSRGPPRPSSTPQQVSQHISEDQSNGVRLRSEMLRIYEYMGSKGQGVMENEDANGEEQGHHRGTSASLTNSSDGTFGRFQTTQMPDSVYERMKDMF
ncbi:fungal-specific transcription factor domain-containing protein [Podospora didyma]|uniref:Fungal-specific transcription factor domain-containing protein n=1 Tax=Podospora didyma TaxID=330526 RepID=A0AAE0TWB7_9PEZI|nr:fungal-specific transcription factor domain-containing protein [Podospora didyma]